MDRPEKKGVNTHAGGVILPLLIPFLTTTSRKPAGGNLMNIKVAFGHLPSPSPLQGLSSPSASFSYSWSTAAGSVETIDRQLVSPFLWFLWFLWSISSICINKVVNRYRVTIASQKFLLEGGDLTFLLLCYLSCDNGRTRTKSCTRRHLEPGQPSRIGKVVGIVLRSRQWLH